MQLKWDNKGLKSPLSRARGYGSAHEGSGHWLQQRFTAVTNFCLMLWLIWSVVQVHGFDYSELTMWLHSPVNAILMILAVLSVCIHASLGVQVVIEDYVHSEGKKFAMLALLRMVLIGAAVASIFSVAKICFGA